MYARYYAEYIRYITYLLFFLSFVIMFYFFRKKTEIKYGKVLKFDNIELWE